MKFHSTYEEYCWLCNKLRKPQIITSRVWAGKLRVDPEHPLSQEYTINTYRKEYVEKFHNYYWLDGQDTPIDNYGDVW